MDGMGINGERSRAIRTQNTGAEPILLADSDEAFILLLHEALRRAEVKNPLFVVYDGGHAIEYLAGIGRFSGRRSNPIPCLLLLEGVASFNVTSL